jgi:2-C-methyl-D-erythritol 4-phosphate cytidylyltransferase
MDCAVIVAAGRGTRMGPGVDKLFLEVAGVPVVGHTWRRFDQHPEIHSVILVIRPDLESAFDELAVELSIRKPYVLVGGGKERQDSVWNGLAAVPTDCQVVAIQDGARPCTNPELITRCLEAARAMGASVAGQPATDTIKEADGQGMIAKHLDRTKLWTVQTPQCFQVEVIRRALQAVREQGLQITDDTAACDLIGQPVQMVAGTAPNPKVTLPSDLPYIELLLRG